MLPYYLLIVPIAAIAAASSRRRPDPVAWSLSFLAIVVFVGLRHHVGMDWNNYLIIIQRANSGNFWNAFDVAEPGYAVLLWIAGQSGWGVYFAYLVGTIIYAYGLFKYAMTTPSPWMALLVAMPYLSVVVAMAAARQTIAIGIIFVLVALWDHAPTWKRLALIALAAMFHASAVFFLVFVISSAKTHWLTKIIGGAITTAGAFYFLQSTGQVNYYNSTYVSGQTEAVRSDGALIHTLLNGGPALFAFAMSGQHRAKLLPNDLHRDMAMVALALVPASIFYSTASSRLTLYLFPVSMYILSGTANSFSLPDRLFVRICISALLVSLLAIWLNFSNSAIAYKNYQNALFIPQDRLRLCCK